MWLRWFVIESSWFFARCALNKFLSFLVRSDNITVCPSRNYLSDKGLLYKKKALMRQIFILSRYFFLKMVTVPFVNTRIIFQESPDSIEGYNAPRCYSLSRIKIKSLTLYSKKFASSYSLPCWLGWWYLVFGWWEHPTLSATQMNVTYFYEMLFLLENSTIYYGLQFWWHIELLCIFYGLNELLFLSSWLDYLQADGNHCIIVWCTLSTMVFDWGFQSSWYWLDINRNEHLSEIWA